MPSEGEASARTETPRWGFQWDVTHRTAPPFNIHLTPPLCLPYSLGVEVRLATLKRKAVGTPSLARCASPGAWRPPPPWSPPRWWGRSERFWTPTAVITSSANASCFSVSTATLGRTTWSNGRWRYVSCPAFHSTVCASRGYRARPSPLRILPAKLPMSSNCDRRWEPPSVFGELWLWSHLITGLVLTYRTKLRTEITHRAESGWTRLVMCNTGRECTVQGSGSERYHKVWPLWRR